MSLIETLIPSQKKALDQITSFMNTPGQRIFRLSGSAGTGKTHLLGCVSEKYNYLAQVGSAPTNKATKVFSAKMPNKPCKTIYSFLGVKMEADEDRLVLTFPHKPVDLNRWDLIYLDEGSMLQCDMCDYVDELSNLYPHLKWILSADRAQLNPIGERESKIWKWNLPTANLTEVVRYDNQILALATHLRNQIENFPEWELSVKSNHKNKEGVWKKRYKDFLHFLEKASKQGLFHEVDHTKAIAWRNATVEQLNATIRGHAYGRHAYDEQFIVGDRLMIASPITFEGGHRANIDDEGTVVQISVTHNTYYKELKCYNLVLKMDEGTTLDVCIIHESSEADLHSKLNQLASAAKSDRKLWKYFWSLKETFHRVRYSFGLTAHRSQGSTYKNCLVDMGDIMSNRDKLEALRALYVSYTRPTTSIITT